MVCGYWKDDTYQVNEDVLRKTLRLKSETVLVTILLKFIRHKLGNLTNFRMTQFSVNPNIVII